MTEYVFKHDNPREPGRLELLEQYVNPLTFSALERLGVKSGWHCADLGAGKGSVADWLVERTSPAGSVAAVDTDTRYLSSRPGLTVHTEDAVAFARANSGFDLVHVRFLLVHLDRTAQDELLSRMHTLLRPGGALVVVESDYSWWVQQSLGDAVLDRVRAAYVAAAQHAGWDLELGSKVPSLLEEHGLMSVRGEGTTHYDRSGSAMCRLLAESVQALSDRILATGLADRRDLAYFHRQFTRSEKGFPYVTTWACTGFISASG